MSKDYRDATKDGVLEAADFMNMIAVPSKRKSPEATPPPRPGTREPEMNEDQLIDMMQRKLGPNFAAAMAVPFHQWGGDWKKMSKKMRARVRAVQSTFNEMKALGLTTAQMAEDDEGDIVL